MAEFNYAGFSGANNVHEPFYFPKGILSPRVILNADVHPGGSLSVRNGKTLFMDLAGAHSLWAGNACMLCAANGTIYRISQGAAEGVAAVDGPDYPLSYAEAKDRVYISNPYWQGIYYPAAGSITPWGVAVPPGPMLLSGPGGLPAGTYHVCMTNVSGDELSGNGPVARITLESEGGIQVLNRPSGALVWVTDTNEGIFYLAGDSDTVADIPSSEPLPSFLCSPPPFMENLCYAFGRIWGSAGPDVYYSEPFHPGWFKPTSNKYPFEDTVTMIAKVRTGLFIGMKRKTRFLAGTIPEQMTVQDAGAGSVRGTLAYCNNIPEPGTTPGKAGTDYTDVPVWLTEEGIVAGSPTGKFYNVTKNKLKMGIPDRGASLYRNLEGDFHYLTGFKAGATGTGRGFRDTDTYNAFKNGRIDTGNKSLERGDTRIGFSDASICRVYRGGVEI